MGVAKGISYATLFGIAAVGINFTDAHMSSPSLPWNKDHQDAIDSNIINVNYYSDRTAVRETATGKTWNLDCTGHEVNFTKQYNLDFTQDGYIITCGGQMGGIRTEPGTIERNVHVKLPFGLNL